MNESINIKLVIVHEWGRLGNQLFQYAAIHKSAPDASIVAVGMDSLKQCLEIDGIVGNSRMHRILTRVVSRMGRERLSHLAGAGRLFSRIQEHIVGCQCHAEVQPGYLTDIAVLSGFFQDPQLVSSIPLRQMPLRHSTVNSAREWLRAKTGTHERHCYFVHVRRGDYIRWPSLEAPAVLSFSWYHAQIEYIRNHDPHAHFVICSDDLPYVNEFFGSRNDATISSGSDFFDLATMSICEGGGILSASTLSWWAAYFARSRNPRSVFIAPRYWAGWRSHAWYPASIQTSWLQYVKGF